MTFGKAGRSGVATLFVLISLPLSLAIGAVILLQIEWAIPFRDIAALAKVHPLTGALSTLGLLVWAGAATVWLCAALLARSIGAPHVATYAGAFLLTLYLSIDDAFLLHEALLPDLLTGSELAPLLGIVAAALALAWSGRAMFLQTPVIYIACLAMLPLSMLLDSPALSSWIPIGNPRNVAEDGAKWIGIVGWLLTAIWHYHHLAARTGLMLQSPRDDSR